MPIVLTPNAIPHTATTPAIRRGHTRRANDGRAPTGEPRLDSWTSIEVQESSWGSSVVPYAWSTPYVACVDVKPSYSSCSIKPCRENAVIER